TPRHDERCATCRARTLRECGRPDQADIGSLIRTITNRQTDPRMRIPDSSHPSPSRERPAPCETRIQTEAGAVMRDFDDLVTEAQRADVSGWGFGWLDGRATEERPAWGFARMLGERLGNVDRALDVDTGGGEVLNEAAVL